ncbi:Transforming acidic coiled-coil-containing protein, partial [Ooceraea biroi]
SAVFRGPRIGLRSTRGMEYINRLLHRATGSPRNSPSPTQTSGNDSPAPAKTAEHEVKVRFAREFADVGAVTENHSTPESLSSASSFRSLSSTLSIKSSSGICADSTPDTPDDADRSYVNSDIPGVEELIFACADIHLGSDSQDLSQDQTFASAIDETSFHASDCSVDESLDNDETRVTATKFQLNQTTAYASLNETCTFAASGNAAPVEDTQSASPSAEGLDAPRVEESIEEPVPLQDGDSVASEPETCDVESNVVEDSPPTSDQVNDSQSNAIKVSPDNSISDDASAVLSEEQTVESYRTAETLSLEIPPSPTKISVPSIPPLEQHTEDSSLPGISSVPSFEDTDSKGAENIVNDVPEPARGASPTLLSTSDDADKEAFALHVNSPVIEAETNESIETHDLLRLDNCAVADNEASSTQLLNRTSIIEREVSEIQESLEKNVDKRDAETRNVTVSIEAPTFLPKDDIAICDKTQRCNPTETVLTESASAAGAVKKKESSFEELDRTLTLQEIEDINLTPDEEEHYEEFKPQRQSTTLSSLIKKQPDFEQFRSTAEQVTNELLNSSTDLAEEQFVSATSEIFQDPSTFDFLLARSNSAHANINRLRTESLYIKFDPLVSNTSMLPQGNAQPVNEEQNGKNESPPPNVDTPKRNPAIAAIDRLLFYSPLPNATVQKLEETQEKIEQEESPKSDINISKELELVRTTVLQLEEKLEKQKKEHAAELERQKAASQEKLNKLQAQLAQEVKTKTQMTVVVEEYEKSISRLLTERERDRTNFEQEKAKLQEELQAANHHLTNTEAAFNDVHQKYERLKGVVSVYKNNETVLKESIQENVETIKTLEVRYDQLKEHAMAQLEKANLELDGIRKQNEAETVKLHAMIRKAELKGNSLNELVEQKTKENKELAKILDEVIARVGHGNTE